MYVLRFSDRLADWETEHSASATHLQTTDVLYETIYIYLGIVPSDSLAKPRVTLKPAHND